MDAPWTEPGVFEIFSSTRAVRRPKPRRTRWSPTPPGLGATLTSRRLRWERAGAAAFGLPEGVRSYANLPIGYPLGRFGPSAARRWPTSSSRTAGGGPIRRRERGT